MDRLAVTFNGTDRFQLLRVLGHGGMGVVYEAKDHNHGTTVALKLLPLVNPEYLLRFKREFRVASGIHHPNLVKLGELVRFGDHWFFTMELVHGVDLLDYVRGASEDPMHSGPRTVAWSSDAHDDEPPEALSAAQPVLTQLQEVKIRATMQKLAGALCALHDAGCVHRDVKPSNVLVTPEGRVVLLDFGLASVAALETTLFLAGTPLYMAPEQALNAPVTPAVDWYSFGVLLFELLTGTLPFKGQMYEVLSAKQGGRAPPVRSLANGIPDDLAALCDALLALDPKQRPSGAEVRERLGEPQHPVSVRTPARTDERALIGRDAEWAELTALLDEVRTSGHGIAVVLSGESGVGKSTLARAFIDAHAKRDDLVTFFSRCYERELVPYKAVDGLLDSVAHFLKHAPEADVERLLPSRAGVIAQVFPVLARVAALSRATLPDLTLDRREVRTWLFSAIRELFANIARERVVIALVDDLHWADNDSMILLSELLREPGSPRMLLLCTRRTQDAAAGAERAFTRDVDERSILLRNLSPAAAWALVTQLAEARDRVVDGARLAEESGGHPLFLRELLEAVLIDQTDAGITLDEVIARRVAQPSDIARKLLSLLAVSGSPLESGILREAAQIDGSALTESLHELRSAQLVHTAGELFDDRIDISHDRVRRALRASLSTAEVEELHLALASALEAHGEPVLSASHWREAQRPERAARHYASAGKVALDALAFGDAASHYRAALSLGTWNDGELTRLLGALGDALSNAGKGAEAAQQYRKAAQSAPPSEAVELKRSAAEELVRSGYLDEGLNVAREVLTEADLAPARSPLYALLVQRTMLRLRGLGFREKSPDASSPRELARIDLCWSMSSGLVLTDTFQGAYFQARGLYLSLRSGDPYRISRSIAAEAAYKASQGPRGRARSEQLLARADELAERVREPRATGTVLLMKGISCHLLGEFSRGRALLHRASAIFREQCTGMFWERDAARQFWIECQFYMGDLPSLRDAVLAGLREASERGAIYTATNLRSGLANAIWLVDDQPDEAERQLAEAMKRWSVHGFHVQHWYALIADVHLALYRQRGDHALSLLERRWPELSASHLLRVHHTRVVALHLRARAALVAAHGSIGTRRAALLEMARRDADTLRQKGGGARWAGLLAELIELGAANLEARVAAPTALTPMAERLDEADLKVFAGALRVAAGGDTSALDRAGVKAPRAFAGMLVPGFGP